MAALTADRHTMERTGQIYSFPIHSNTVCYSGGLATVDASGFVRPGAADSASATSVAVGRFRRKYDNRTGADNLVAATVADVESGIFHWDNDTAGTAVTVALLRHNCFVLDDHTVSGSSNSSARTIAGVVMDVDATGVWVATGIPTPAGF